MIEVVAYGDPQSRQFIGELQQRTVNRINGGLEAMLHWGLEVEKMRALQLGKVKALQRPTGSGPNKLNAFKRVRAFVHEAAKPGTFRVFDNSCRQNFKGDVPFQLSISRAIDFPHSANADEFGDGVICNASSSPGSARGLFRMLFQEGLRVSLITVFQK